MHKHFYESINGGTPTCIDDDIPFEIPDSWEWCRLGDFCLYGEAPSIKVNACAPETWVLDLEDIVAHEGRITKRISASERPSSSSKYSFERGSVLYSKLRPYLNKVIVAEESGCCTTEIIPIRLFAEVSPYYLQYLLMSPLFVEEINNEAYGVKMPRADTKLVKSFLIPVPPIREQQRIVDLLEAQNEQLNTLQLSRKRYTRMLKETPTSLRQQLIQAAIQGQLVPQNPNDEPASILLERIAQERTAKPGKKEVKSMSRIERRGSKTYELFPDGSEKDISDEIPFEIPENWAWVRLGNLCAKIGAGSTPKGGKAVYKENGILFLRSQNVYNNGLRLEKAAFIEPAVDKSMAGSRVESLDLLLNITGASIGRCAIVPPEIWRANVNQHVLILRCIDKSMVEFVHTCIVAPFTFKHIMALQVGATKEGLSAQNASRLLLPIPPYAEQQRIVTTLNTVLPYLAL